MTTMTKGHAEAICKKLLSVDESAKGGAHDRHCVYHGKILLGHVGIRHGSNKDQPHNHIPKDLNVPFHFALELATCTKSRHDYLVKVGAIRSNDSDEVTLPAPQYPWQKDWPAIQEEEAKARQLSEGNAQGQDS